jgi:hypothetical protein
MSSDLFPFVAASAVALCATTLKVIGRVVIVAIRSKPQENDYVFSDDLALFGLVLGIGCLVAYQKIPDLVCPLAAKGVVSFGDLFGLVLSLQFVFFLVSVLLVGRIEKRDASGYYDKEQYKKTKGWSSWRVVWRNMIGVFPLLLALTIMFLRPEFF